MGNPQAPSKIWSGQVDPAINQDASFERGGPTDRGYQDSQIRGTQTVALAAQATAQQALTAAGVAPITFASLATLAPSGTHAKADLDCYAVVGDQGGGRFHWDANSTATPDGGTVSYGQGNTNPAVLGRWIRDITSPRSKTVRDYGASPISSASVNTAAIQSAASAVAAAGGGEVFVPAGTYLINPSTILLPTNVSLVGENRGGGNSGFASCLKTSTPGRMIMTGYGANGGRVGLYGRIANLAFVSTAVVGVVQAWQPGATYTVGTLLRPRATNAVCQGPNVFALSPRLYKVTAITTGISGSFQPIGTLFAQGAGGTPPPDIRLTNAGAIANDNLVDIEIVSWDGATLTFKWTATNIRNNSSGGTWTTASCALSGTPTGGVYGSTALGTSGYTVNFLGAGGTYVATQIYRTPSCKWSLKLGDTFQDGGCTVTVVESAVGLDDVNGGEMTVENCSFSGQTIDMVFDGTQILHVRGCTGGSGFVSYWLANGGEHLQGVTTYQQSGGISGALTNDITIQRVVGSPGIVNGVSVGGVAVIDDGGVGHSIEEIDSEGVGDGFRIACVTRGDIGPGDIEVGQPSAWLPNHPYGQDERVTASPTAGFIFQASHAGTSGATQPTWNNTTGATQPTDGGVTWVCMGPSVGGTGFGFSDVSFFGFTQGFSQNVQIRGATCGGGLQNVDCTPAIVTHTVSGLTLERCSFDTTLAVARADTIFGLRRIDCISTGTNFSNAQTASGGMSYHAGHLALGAYMFAATNTHGGTNGLPNCDLDVAGQVAFRQLTWSANAAVNHNVSALLGTQGNSAVYSYVEFTTNNTATDTAIDGFMNGVDGALLLIGNSFQNSANLTLVNSALSGSSPGNKILFPDGLSYVTIGPGGFALLEYDAQSTVLAWRLRQWSRSAQVACTINATGTTSLTSAGSVLTTAHLGAPTVFVNAVTLTGAATLDLSGIVFDGRDWDFSNVALGGQTLSLKNGTTTKNVTTLLGTKTLLRLVASSANSLSVG